MIKDSGAVRSAAVAFVFPTQPVLTRDDNLRFYDLATAGGLELAEFSQTPTEVVLAQKRRGPPAGAFHIRVDHFGPQLRFMVGDDFPSRPLSLFGENADAGWEAFQQVWPVTRTGPPGLVEVTLRLTAPAAGGNATEYLGRRTLQLSDSALKHLGRAPQGVGLKLMFPLQVARPTPLPLDGADAILSVETLLEDFSRLYFETTVKWPTVPLPPNAPAGLPAQINTEIRKPSEYVEDVYGFLTTQVVAFLEAAAH